MTTALATPHRSLTAIVAQWWKNRTGNRAGVAELDKLDAGAKKQIARDVGVESSELRALAGKWPDSADFLLRRMATLHLDVHRLGETQPRVLNDLKKHCSLCGSKRRCGHDLDVSAVDPIWRSYCPNSTTLMALMAEPKELNNDPRR